MENFEEYKTFKISPEKAKKIFFSESKSGSESLSPYNLNWNQSKPLMH